MLCFNYVIFSYLCSNDNHELIKRTRFFLLRPLRNKRDTDGTLNFVRTLRSARAPFPILRALIQLLRKHWSLVQDDPSLSLLFPSPPQLSYRRNPTLRDSLVRASLPGSSRPPTGQVPPIPINRLEPRMIKCADGRCKVCPKAEGRRILFSTVSNTPYAFHETFTCTDTSLIYCIVCDKCGKLYIGLTSNSLKVRFRAHRHSSETRKLIPLYRHFARKSHNFLRDHRIVPLEHCEPDALAEREAY